MLCPVCHGSGSIVSFRGGIQYWPCPCCGGAGVTWQIQPPFFNAKTRKIHKDQHHDQ